MEKELQMYINFEDTQNNEIAVCRDVPLRVSMDNRGIIQKYV